MFGQRCFLTVPDGLIQHRWPHRVFRDGGIQGTFGVLGAAGTGQVGRAADSPLWGLSSEGPAWECVLGRAEGRGSCASRCGSVPATVLAFPCSHLRLFFSSFYWQSPLLLLYLSNLRGKYGGFPFYS